MELLLKVTGLVYCNFIIFELLRGKSLRNFAS
jgi:hypothetical protein